MALRLKDIRAVALGITATGASGKPVDDDSNPIEGAACVADANVNGGANENLVEYAIDISDATKASAAITLISKAIDLVSAERSKLGAIQNRLEHTINNLGIAVENLAAAESRIRDLDMAREMMEFTKLNILQQSGTAMLAQANQQPRSVLQLLGRG